MAETVVIIGFIQSLFGILIFVWKRPKHLCFTLLSVWLAVNAIFLGALLLPFQVVDYFKPGIFPLLFLFGPLLFFYVSSLTIEEFKIRGKHAMHLLPLLLVGIHRSITNVVSISSNSGLSENIEYLNNKIYFILLIISLFLYWVFSVKLILKHRKTIPFYFSNYSKKNTLTWLIFVVLIFLLFFMIIFFLPAIEKLFNLSFTKYISLQNNLTIFTFIMVFFGINQSAIFKFKKEEQHNSSIKSEKKYQRSSLTEIQIANINDEVFNYLSNKKPYLNPEYSLQMMVDDLNISRQNLSQVINSGQKKNFYQLINDFRVNEVKTLISNAEYSHYTILGIAFQCGFNSKSSFNRIFKEETGFTPTTYKKSL